MTAPKLQTVEIRKVYPGTEALKGVSLCFEGGKVNALIGKNGAGKSTLVKILSGAVAPTSGRILVDGQDVQLRTPGDAFHKGIATVYQEMSLVPELSVAENILLGRLPRHGPMGIAIDWPEVYRRAAEVLRGMNVAIDVRQKVSRLSVAQQQIVEIAKAMSFSPAVLMLDEPTSALAHHETQSLFALLRQLAGKGVAIVYISHRLQELKEIADTVSVLRDGAFVGAIDIAQATPEVIVRMMFGQTILKSRPASLSFEPQPVLEVRRLCRPAKLQDINFTLHKGEVLGIAGMLGSGRSELLMSLFGAEPIDQGEILVHGRPASSRSPQRMKKLGLGLAPENRKEQGLVLSMSTRDNICLAGLNRISRGGILWKGRQRGAVDRTIADLQIKVPSVDQPVSSLSGGNQQKVVIGNWLNTQPDIMLFDEPTRGIDVQAKQQIFQILWDLSQKGIASIFVSSELEELLEVCHRILIMRKGRITGEVRPEEVTLESLFALCMEG